MPLLTYVLPDSFLQEFPLLRKNYEAIAKVDLEKTPQPTFFSAYLGATNIEIRKTQILFLEGLYDTVKDKLRPALDFTSEAEVKNHVTALRILIAGCLFVIAQIDATYTFPRDSSSSELGQLLIRLLRLDCEKSHDNPIDSETRSASLLTAQQFLTSRNVFERLESSIPVQMNSASWLQFNQYIKKECDLLTQEYSHYPCRDFMMPACSDIMKLVGYAPGYVLGDALGKSSAMISSRQALTAALSSGLVLLMGPSARLGVIVLIPTCAGKILDMFCGMSLAYVLGASMGIAGMGIGWGVGMTMDLSVQLLQKACQLISRTYYGEGRLPNVNGITLVNSNRVINGMEYEVDASYQQHDVVFEAKPEGISLSIGNEHAFIPWDLKLPFMEELRTKLLPDLSGKMPLIEFSEKEKREEEEERSFSLFPAS